VTTTATSALVTGASRGIGRAIVQALRARGMTVHALALDDDELRDLVAETGAIPIGLDIRDVAALETALAGREFDVVVNNAGVLPQLQPFVANASAAIDLVVDVNLRAVLHVTRLVLPIMVANDRGHLFYVGSIGGRHPSPNTAVYAATKAAVHAFAEGLRCDLLGSSIRVSVLMPGRVETALYDGVFGDHGQAAAVLYDGFEAVQPEDVAAVLLTAMDLPPNVDLTAIEVVPTKQVFGGSTIARDRTPAA
jgi:NADP-dependent 3-hydroxy acid dehydrogenase YdfG